MFATVCEIDKDAGMVRLDVLGRVTNWLPCVGSTPSVGQQVSFAEYENDGTGVVFGTTARSDGAAISLHIGGIDVTIDGASIVLKSDAEVTGSVKIIGDLEVDGNITTSGTVTDTKGDLTNFSTTDGAQRA
jgi:phage baseplate assembly protein gpV